MIPYREEALHNHDTLQGGIKIPSVRQKAAIMITYRQALATIIIPYSI